MSGPRLSIIPARAATDSALKPRDLQVLCVLGRHTDDLGWCRKSQVKMAAEMSCARSTVYEAIERLIKAGYLERHIQEESSGRDSPHVYRVVLDPQHRDVGAVADCDRDDIAQDPADIAAPPAGISAPPAGSGPAPKNDPSRTFERERAREDEGQEGQAGAADADAKSVERRGWALLANWPGFAGMPKEPAMREWRGMSPQDREDAERLFQPWLALLRAQKKSHVPAPSTYFREKLFADVPEPLAQEMPQLLEAKPFGPLWAAMVVRALLGEPKPAPPPPSKFIADLIDSDSKTGMAERLRRQAAYGWPQVKEWYRQAENRRGFAAPSADSWIGGLTEPVPAKSLLIADWRDEFARRGWPWLPNWGGMPVVYLPKGGPDGLSAFEQALNEGNGTNECGGGREAAE